MEYSLQEPILTTMRLNRKYVLKSHECKLIFQYFRNWQDLIVGNT